MCRRFRSRHVALAELIYMPERNLSRGCAENFHIHYLYQRKRRAKPLSGIVRDELENVEEPPRTPPALFILLLRAPRGGEIARARL